MQTIEKPKTPATKPESKPVNVGFVALLQQHREGAALSELGEALKEATRSVYECGNTATITLKLKLSPATRTAGAMVVEDDIALKLPKPEKGNSIFFADKDSWNLLRDNPNQMALELKTVDGMADSARVPLKEVQ